MSVRPPPENRVEVDMVPLIDIVTLLLMFLIVVGDMAKSTSCVKMRLPRADQARSEKEIPDLPVTGRIVVQLVKDRDLPKFWAVVENHRFDLIPQGNSPSLATYLDQVVERRIACNVCTKDLATGAVSFPVKLRISKDAPMFEVERLMMVCAKSGLVNVHYAAAPGLE